MIRSGSSLDDLRSYVLVASNKASIEDVLSVGTKKLKYPFEVGRHIGGHCSGFVKSLAEGRRVYVFVPVDFMDEEFKSPKFLEKWAKEINLITELEVTYHGEQQAPFEGTTFDGFKAYFGNKVINGRRLTNNFFSVFSFETTDRHLQEYMAYCLIRYLWAQHYHNIVHTYWLIKRGLCKTKPDPIHIMQLAHYGYQHDGYTHFHYEGFYGILNFLKCKKLGSQYVALKMLDPEHVRTNLYKVGSQAVPNFLFTNTLSDAHNGATVQDVCDLLVNKKYKKAYELVR